jgi:hypothetical protein
MGSKSQTNAAQYYTPNRFKLASVCGSALQGDFTPQVDCARVTRVMWLEVALLVINKG